MWGWWLNDVDLLATDVLDSFQNAYILWPRFDEKRNRYVPVCVFDIQFCRPRRSEIDMILISHHHQQFERLVITIIIMINNLNVIPSSSVQCTASGEEFLFIRSPLPVQHFSSHCHNHHYHHSVTIHTHMISDQIKLWLWKWLFGLQWREWFEVYIL